MDVFQRLDAEGIDVCLKALDDLWRAPGDDAARARVAAVEVLGSMGQLAPIEPLILALADPFWDVRAAAAQALGNMGEYTPVDFLTSLLELERDESVGETIIRVLGRQGKRMPVSKLVKILRYDKSWMLRQAAAWALGELGTHAPIKWLGYALKHDEDECVRIAAVRSLGQTGKSQVKKMFYDALLDPEEEVREEVRRAIELLDKVSSSQQEHGDVSVFERLDSSSDTLSGEEADDEMVTDVLNQMVAAWITTLKEPTVCQRPHDLINIKIWYQCAPDDLIEKEETVK